MVTWLQSIDEELLYAPLLSSFTSIDYTLQHIFRTQRFWYTFITQQDITQLNWTVREKEVQLVMQELVLLSDEMKNRFANYSENELLQILHLNTPWATNDLSRYEYMVHVVNHSTFHRGQIVTMARSLGITTGVPNTDYNIFNTPF
jgi:uncharacterized damage-inducible protein DinB